MKRMSKVFCFILSLVMLACCVPTGIVSSAASYNWAGSWGSPALDSGITLGNSNLKDVIPANSTIRTVITPTLGGTKIRLKFSNLFGDDAVTISETTIANTGETDDLIIEDSVTQVTFNGGQKSVTIAAGSEVYSDEINFRTTALKKVSISTYYKKTTTMYTVGLYGGNTYLCSSLGNRTHNESMTAVATRLTFTSNTITYYTIPFLSRLDVYAQDAYCVVLLGDSTVTNDIYLMLAEKVNANGIKNIGFVMSGIIGNELLNDGTGLLGTVYGQALVTRAKRDAFNVAGVKYVIVKCGVNDILHPMLKSNEGMAQTTPTQVINGYKQLASQLTDSSVKMYLCTRTPYKGYTRNFMGSDDLEWTQKGENMLLEINKWIKSSYYGYFDGYIDLDAVRDPDDSAKLRSHMTADGVHFTQYGQIAVTDLIPEAAYGVNKDLKNYASILNIDPYVAPVVETTTKKQTASTTKNNSDNNSNNSADKNTAETTTAKQNANVIVPAGTETTTFSSVVVSPETTTENANQIFVDTNQQNDGLVGSVSDDSSTTRQMAGFAILAAVSIAIIAVAAVMLARLSPSKSAPLTRGNGGRAKQKKRV